MIPLRHLGNTGLKVSILGLGCGGNSRLGLAYGLSESHAADIVRAALDMGITMVDTARVYGTEPAVGIALSDSRRDGVVVSSKSPYLDPSHALLSSEAFAENIDASLRSLGLETIDIYFIHGLRPQYYTEARDRFLPVLQKAKRQGKIRFYGLTEAFETDTSHAVLQRAVRVDDWEMFMVGYNLLNPSGRERVLCHTAGKGIGTLGMFAVRRGLIDEALLRILLKRLEVEKSIEPGLAEAPDLMDTLALKGVCESFSEAAYRFCAYTPGMDCVLSGTSSAEHLRANLDATLRGPLPQSTLARLEKLFGRVDSISGQVRE